ncbi:hypothetical protein D3C86_2059470 [compost metagenome]
MTASGDVFAIDIIKNRLLYKKCGLICACSCLTSASLRSSVSIFREANRLWVLSTMWLKLLNRA